MIVNQTALAQSSLKKQCLAKWSDSIERQAINFNALPLRILYRLDERICKFIAFLSKITD